MPAEHGWEGYGGPCPPSTDGIAPDGIQQARFSTKPNHPRVSSLLLPDDTVSSSRLRSSREQYSQDLHRGRRPTRAPVQIRCRCWRGVLPRRREASCWSVCEVRTSIWNAVSASTRWTAIRMPLGLIDRGTGVQCTFELDRILSRIAIAGKADDRVPCRSREQISSVRSMSRSDKQSRAVPTSRSRIFHAVLRSDSRSMGGSARSRELSSMRQVSSSSIAAATAWDIVDFATTGP